MNDNAVMKPKTSSPTESSPSKVKAKPLVRKPGANHSETTDKPRKHDNNFKQSNDLREDRGVRQIKSAPKNRA
jgi:hypothetical protein